MGWFDGIFDIIMANEGFWLNILIPFMFAGYMLYNHREYVLHEFVLQVLLTVVIIFFVFYLFFRNSTDLYSVNYYNGWVKQFEHYDDYTSTETYSCGTAKAPRTCTRTVYHPDEYYVVTSNGHQIEIRETNWNTAKREFGEGSNGLFGGTNVNFSQSWGGSESYALPNRRIPASKPISEINYVKATAHNIVRANTFKEEIDRGVKKGLLHPYPTLKTTKYGNIRINRIMGNYYVSNVLQLEMDKVAMNLGTTKQVNPLIYIVTGQSRDFAHTLKSYWVNGAKNDAILVLGMKDGVVEWSETIAWTKNVDFLVNQTKIYKGDKLDEKLIGKFAKQIQMYFVREPMKNYKFLEDEISLSIWAQLSIILINLIGSFLLFRHLLRN